MYRVGKGVVSGNLIRVSHRKSGKWLFNASGKSKIFGVYQEFQKQCG